MNKLRDKKYLLDYHGINAVWSRIYSSHVVTVVSTFDEMRRAFEEGAVLRFSRSQDETRFREGLSYIPAADARIGLLEDDPELTAAGLTIVHNYPSLSQVPALHFLDISGGVAVQEIEVIGRKIDPFDMKSITNCGARFSGDLLRISKGHLSVLLGEGARLSFTGSLRIGENTSITLERNAVMDLGSDCSIGPGSQIYLREGAEFIVGDRASFGRVTVQGFLRIEIGRDFLSAHDLVLRDGDGHDILGLDLPNAPNTIVIGDHVWTGEQVALLKGAKVGSDSVVARGSMVTKQFDVCSLLGGAPARLLREGVGWKDEYTAYQRIKNQRLKPQ